MQKASAAPSKVKADAGRDSRFPSIVGTVANGYGASTGQIVNQNSPNEDIPHNLDDKLAFGLSSGFEGSELTVLLFHDHNEAADMAICTKPAATFSGGEYRSYPNANFGAKRLAPASHRDATAKARLVGLASEESEDVEQDTAANPTGRGNAKACDMVKMLWRMVQSANFGSGWYESAVTELQYTA